jgi:HD-like signal output (HDOD) protein
MKTMQANTQAIALQILQSNVRLPPFPPVGSQLLDMNHQPPEEIDISKFIQLIETDPSLVTHILKLANSVYFQSVQKISSLRQAVMHIGMGESINAVSWHFFQTALPKFPRLEGFSGKDYWAHSWACAVANRMLGRPDLLATCLPGELYIAGLLHGVGKLILALHRPEDFMQCLENSRNFNQPLFESELDLFGTTDTDIAYEILTSWQFPEKICMAVKHYRMPEEADQPFREIAAATQFAYYIANTSGVGNNGDIHSFDLQDTVLGRDADSPFAHEATRNRVVQDIYATLQKKYLAISNDQDASEQKKLSAMPKKKPVAPGTRRKSPKKKSWFSRILSFFK